MDHATAARLRPVRRGSGEIDEPLLLLTCDMCSLSPTTTVLDACGHLFCFSCLHRVLPGEGPVRLDSCPLCRNNNVPIREETAHTLLTPGLTGLVGTCATGPVGAAASAASHTAVDSLLGNSVDSQLEYINNELNRINDELDRLDSLLGSSSSQAS